MKKFFTRLSSTLLFICGITFSVSSQTTSSANTFYNKGDQVYIQTGALLHVQGDFTNAAGGTTSNLGVLNVEGDALNAGTYTSTAGGSNESTLRLIGNGYLSGATTGEQAITGFNGTSSLYNLVIDKGSTQVVRLKSDMEVKGSLVWNASGVTAATYTPSTSPILNTSALMTVRPTAGSAGAYAANTGNGRILTYDGTSDYELYVSNGTYNAVAGYQTIVPYYTPSGFTVTLPSAANHNPTVKDGYVETRSNTGVAKGFAQLINSGGNTTTSVYTFPLGGSTASYNAMKIYFASISGSFKLVSKFTDNTAAAPLSATSFRDHFDQGNSVGSGVQYLDTTRTPLDYTNNPGYNVYQNNNCSGAPYGGKWVSLNKAILNGHGYWSFDAPSGTTCQYVVEAYPHGYSEYPTYVSGQRDPVKRVIRENADGFTSIPQVDNFYLQMNTNLANPTHDIASYTTDPNYDRFTACNDGTGVPGGMYTSFSHLSIGSSSSNTGSALPVKLIALTATPVDNSYIRVDWATASEINNKGFDVMRSDDGVSFTKIGWVDGNGTTAEQHNYSYDDKTALPGIVYYYKLNQVDIDGHSEETYVVSAEITDGPTLYISDFQPNPTVGATRITISTTDALPAYIKFYDLLGQEIISHDYHLDYGTNVIDLNTSDLASATYTAMIKVGNKIFSRRLVVVR